MAGPELSEVIRLSIANTKLSDDTARVVEETVPAAYGVSAILGYPSEFSTDM